MSVRNRHARTSRNYFYTTIGGFRVGLFFGDGFCLKEMLYSAAKKIRRGTLVANIEEWEGFAINEDGTIKPIIKRR